MKEEKIFEAFAQMWESFTNPKSAPIDYGKYGCNINKSGAGDPTYPLTVVCHFHSAVGEDWEDFCQYYMPTKKQPESFTRSAAQRARRFWERIDNSKFELERLAAYHFMVIGEN